MQNLSVEPSELFAVVYVLQLVLSIVVNFILSFRLNPLFDPLLGEYIDDKADWMPSLTMRFIHAGLYANWVVKKEWFGRNRPEVQRVDFRSRISGSTLALCWVYTVNGWSLVIEMFIAAIFLWTGNF